MKRIVLLLIINTLFGFQVTNFSFNTQNGFSKNEKQKINNMIAFELFLNFDLSIKNKDLSIVYDYVPNNYANDIKRVKLESNIGFSRSDIEFRYHKHQLIEIDYKVDEAIYNYKIEYKKNMPIVIKVNDKIKYRFVYEKKLLTKVLHYKNDEVNVVFYINYQNKFRAKLESRTSTNGSLNKDHSYTNFTWNKNFKTTSLELLKFKISDIKYNKLNDVKSFNDDSPITESIKTTWSYTYDSKNNWIKRESGNIVTERKFEYSK